jgi:high affinity Mn2+ porin
MSEADEDHRRTILPRTAFWAAAARAAADPRIDTPIVRRMRPRRTQLHAVAVAWLLTGPAPLAQEPVPGPPPASSQPGPAHPYLLGVQATAVAQAAPGFASPYAGANSLRGGEGGLSQTYTLFLGIRAIDGLDVYLEPEAVRGRAPGQGAGLAGYCNGDLLGQPGRFDVYVARAFVRWRMALGPEREPEVRLGRARYLVDETVPARRLVVTIGQLAITDLLDQNLYANSARTQFLNLSFVNDLAYDFPQDAHGYSRGAFVDFVSPSFAARAASFQVPSGPGGALSWALTSERADAVELTWSPSFLRLASNASVVRLLAWRNEGRMGRYEDALRAAGGSAPSLADVRRRGAVRFGAGLNLEVPLADDSATGLFARSGLSRGGVETLSFAESDAVLSVGAQVSGSRWGRRDDVIGVAAGVDLASPSHRSYLAAGGTGLRLGDGALRYGPELDTEGYYAFAVTKAFVLSADLQGIANPGFNRDRGPVILLGLRAHLEL